MPDLISPWVPMSNSCDLKHMGKLAEEVGELSAAIARCIIQGLDECEPVTLKPNREWLEDEIADVLAGVRLATERFNLNIPRMEERTQRKINGLRRWHNMLETPNA